MAIGRPKFVTADMVSEGTVASTWCQPRPGDGAGLCGDVDFACRRAWVVWSSPLFRAVSGR